MARPTKLTSRVQKTICAAIKAGNYFSTACEHAGIPEQTGYEWLARGEGKQPRGRKRNAVYANFAEAVRLAEAKAETDIVQIIRDAIPENPRLGLDFIARRHPDHWAPRETLTILQKLAKQAEGMTDAELLAFLSRRAGRADPGACGSAGGAAPGAGVAGAGAAGE